MSTRTPRLEPDWKPEQLGRKEQRHAKTYCTKMQLLPRLPFRNSSVTFRYFFSGLGHVYRSLGIPGLVRCALHTTLGQVPSGLAQGPCDAVVHHLMHCPGPCRRGAAHCCSGLDLGVLHPSFWDHLEGHCFGCWKWKSSKNIQSLEALGELAEEHSVTLSRLNIWWVKSTCVKGECEHNRWKLQN